MSALTAKQVQVLAFIHDFQRLNGAPPTIAEIAGGFGWRSTNAAQVHVDALIRKTYLTRAVGLSRSLVLDGKAIAAIAGVVRSFTNDMPRFDKPASSKRMEMRAEKATLRECTKWGVSPLRLEVLKALGVPEAYERAMTHASRRCIAWGFTPATWWRVWAESGKFTNRGVHDGQFVMARYQDKGPYAPWNVRIITTNENIAEGYRFRNEAQSAAHAVEARA